MLPYYAKSPAAARRLLARWRGWLPPTACVRGAVVLAAPPVTFHVVVCAWYIKHGQWRFRQDDQALLELPDLEPATLQRAAARTLARWENRGFEQDEKRDWGVALHLQGADLDDEDAALLAVQAPSKYWANREE